MALSTLAAQSFSATPIQLSANAPAAVQLAALDLPASSSSDSNAPSLFDAPTKSRLTVQGAAVASTPRTSAHPLSGLAVQINFGVAGVGVDVATPLVRRHLNLRGGTSFFTYNNATLTEDNINIDGSVKLKNASAMVDWFPFRGSFRISGGVTTYNNTGLTASLAVPAGQNFTLGGTTYYSQPGNPITGNGTLTFGTDKVAPRITIGFGNMLPERGHLRLITEVGIQYLSAPTVVYTIAGGGCTGGVGGVYTDCGPVPQSSVISEQNNLQNDLKDLRYYPIVSLGLSYKIH
jgi:hypothetical protein